MKIITWSIVNNEKDFITDVIDYHAGWVDQMYILDTGSVDGTLDILHDKSKQYQNVVYERYHTSYRPRYELTWEDAVEPFPEVDVRNYAIDRCKQMCRPDWLIQLDGDEVFLSAAKDVIEQNKTAVALNHHTINVTGDLSTHRVEHRFGKVFYDPHSRIWNARYNIKYILNPDKQGKQIHCNPSIIGWNAKHLFEIPGTKWICDPMCHLHLHWCYGDKLEGFMRHNRKIFDKKTMIGEVPMNRFASLLPSVFLERRKQWETIPLQ